MLGSHPRGGQAPKDHRRSQGVIMGGQPHHQEGGGRTAPTHQEYDEGIRGDNWVGTPHQLGGDFECGWAKYSRLAHNPGICGQWTALSLLVVGSWTVPLWRGVHIRAGTPTTTDASGHVGERGCGPVKWGYWRSGGGTATAEGGGRQPGQETEECG